MSQRITLCPACKSRFVEAVTIHNPETTNLNSRATLRCQKCKHEWEGVWTSPHTHMRRVQGRLR